MVVVGAAKSGVAAARLLARKGADVFLTDSGALSAHARSELAAAGVPFEEGGHTEAAQNGDWLVVSPGVPDEAAIVQTYLASGRAVISEIEVGSWYDQGRIVAVTGSNGKTTTTSWLDHVWTTADARTCSAATSASPIATSWRDRHPKRPRFWK